MGEYGCGILRLQNRWLLWRPRRVILELVKGQRAGLRQR